MYRWLALMLCLASILAVDPTPLPGISATEPGVLHISEQFTEADIQAVISSTVTGQFARSENLREINFLSEPPPGVLGTLLRPEHAAWRAGFQKVSFRGGSEPFLIDTITGLTGVQEVHLRETDVGDGMAKAIAKCEKLREVFISKSRLTNVAEQLRLPLRMSILSLVEVTFADGASIGSGGKIGSLMVGGISDETGTFSKAVLKNLSEVNRLMMTESTISAGTMDNISTLALKHLQLTKIRLSNEVMAHRFFKEHKLAVLNLSKCGLSNEDVSRMRFAGVSYLIISDNNLSDDVIPAVLAIPDLVDLAIGGNRIGNPGARTLLVSGKLVGLGLQQLPIDDGLFQSVEGMAIQGLGLTDTKIGDVSLTNLTRIKGIKILNVMQTMVTDEAVRKATAENPGIRILHR